MELRQLTLEDVKPLRDVWIGELSVPLVVDFFERAVRHGTCWGLFLKGELVCYWIYLEGSSSPWCEDSILEFYIRRDYRALSDEVFQLVTRQSEPRGIYVRSDDAFLLSFMLEKGYTFDVVGPLLVRERRVSLRERENLDFRPVSEETFDAAFKILTSERPENAGVKVEDYHRLRADILRGTHWCLLREGMVVGVAYWVRQSYGNYVTIFPIVHRSYRGRGYGSYMVSRLAEYVESRGYRPVSFMNQFNLAARRAFKKSGFHVAALHVLFKL